MLAVLIYLLLHGTDRLYIFSIFRDFKCIRYINAFHRTLHLKFPAFFTNNFIRNYAVDILWFTSFCLMMLYFYPEKNNIIKYIVLFGTGILSEALQYIYPQLGTFDFYDVAVYGSITVVCFLTSFMPLK